MERDRKDVSIRDRRMEDGTSTDGTDKVGSKGGVKVVDMEQEGRVGVVDDAAEQQGRFQDKAHKLGVASQPRPVQARAELLLGVEATVEERHDGVGVTGE